MVTANTWDGVAKLIASQRIPEQLVIKGDDTATVAFVGVPFAFEAIMAGSKWERYTTGMAIHMDSIPVVRVRINVVVFRRNSDEVDGEVRFLEMSSSEFKTLASIREQLGLDGNLYDIVCWGEPYNRRLSFSFAEPISEDMRVVISRSRLIKLDDLSWETTHG